MLAGVESVPQDFTTLPFMSIEMWMWMQRRQKSVSGIRSRIISNESNSLHCRPAISRIGSVFSECYANHGQQKQDDYPRSLTTHLHTVFSLRARKTTINRGLPEHNTGFQRGAEKLFAREFS